MNSNVTPKDLEIKTSNSVLRLKFQFSFSFLIFHSIHQKMRDVEKKEKWKQNIKKEKFFFIIIQYFFAFSCHSPQSIEQKVYIHLDFILKTVHFLVNDSFIFRRWRSIILNVSEINKKVKYIKVTKVVALNHSYLWIKFKIEKWNGHTVRK